MADRSIDDREFTGAMLGVDVPSPRIGEVLAVIDAGAHLALALASDSGADASERFFATGACRELALLGRQIREAILADEVDR